MNTSTVCGLMLAACALLIAIGTAGCAQTSVTDPSHTQTPSIPAAPPLPPELPDRLQMLMLSTDLAVGDNRIAFGIVRYGEGPLKNAEVELQTFLLSDTGSADGPRQTVATEFHEWPGGAGGAYVAYARFDEPGEWGLRIETTSDSGITSQAGARVAVDETGSTPAVGSFGPRSENRTARDVDDLADLTSDTDPDPDLYGMTIAEAVADTRPLLVSFTTPAYCSAATCGPQMEVVKRLKDRHTGKMNFIHVEVYDNPSEIRSQGVSVAKVAPPVTEWGLPSEPWTFILDSHGAIAAKFEGFVGDDELETAIAAVLPSE